MEVNWQNEDAIVIFYLRRNSKKYQPSLFTKKIIRDEIGAWKNIFFSFSILVYLLLTLFFSTMNTLLHMKIFKATPKPLVINAEVWELEMKMKMPQNPHSKNTYNSEKSNCINRERETWEARFRASGVEKKEKRAEVRLRQSSSIVGKSCWGKYEARISMYPLRSPDPDLEPIPISVSAFLFL